MDPWVRTLKLTCVLARGGKQIKSLLQKIHSRIHSLFIIPYRPTSRFNFEKDNK